MAGVSLLALLDDIASILDDVSVLTKVAARKTAGVLGDDLALNAQQVSGVVAQRELPVVWAVAKGSFVNKVVLVPAALAVSAFLPWLVTPLLMLGGAYLCYEGAEKVLHKFFHKDASIPNPDRLLEQPPADPVAEEKKKIRGAVRTDFILSAEIIVIALGTVPESASLAVRATVLSLIGLVMTVGVYGLVAAIVKMDDAGLLLIKRSREGGFQRAVGKALVGASPKLMRFLSVVGTIAMFLVGGGILVHGFPFMHAVTASLAALPMPSVTGMLLNAAVGLVAGTAIVLAVSLVKRIRKAA